MNIKHDVHVAIGCFPTLIGAWGGSMFVPLDWDVWWQYFPVPNVFFAVLFFSVYHAVRAIRRPKGDAAYLAKKTL